MHPAIPLDALSATSPPTCRALGTVLQVAVPPLLVAYLQGLAPLPEERRLDALPGDVASGACCFAWRGLARAACNVVLGLHCLMQ